MKNWIIGFVFAVAACLESPVDSVNLETTESELINVPNPTGGQLTIAQCRALIKVHDELVRQLGRIDKCSTSTCLAYLSALLAAIDEADRRYDAGGCDRQ